MKDIQRLEAALSQLDVNELEGLISDIELPRDKGAGRRIAERLMRKEKITMSRSIRKKTAAIIVALAAAMGCTAAAGAYLYNSYAHQKENVSALYGDSAAAEELGSRGLLDGEQQQFDHLVISKDTKVIFDGYFARFSISVMPVDAQGHEMTDDTESNLLIDVEAFDEDGNNMLAGGGQDYNYGDGYLGLSRECLLSEYCESLPVKVKIIDQKSNNAVAELDYTFEKNVDSVTFTDERGRRIYLSEISMMCFDGVDIYEGFDRYAEAPGSSTAFTMIKNDGSEDVFNYSRLGLAGYDGETSSCEFVEFIDPNSVSAILLDGGRFTAE
ncbi:MAG: hypothetical protein IJ746_07835 [Ruminococcus sp.]|nr:hypothetical protein [Ruminococcus sp.]